jgi:hypothetical protein
MFLSSASERTPPGMNASVRWMGMRLFEEGGGVTRGRVDVEARRTMDHTGDAPGASAFGRAPGPYFDDV